MTFHMWATRRDLVNFVLHQVDSVRDFSNHQSSKEPPLP
jgi:hypothetical protein